MAATVRKDYLFKLMEESKLPYFQVTDGRALIGENDTEGSIEKAKQMLEDVLSYVEDSFVVIKLSDKGKKERAKGGRDHSFYEFRVNLQEKKGVSGTGDGLNSTILAMMEKNNDLTRQLLIQQKDFEIEQLKKEKAELEKGEKPNPIIEHAINALAGHFAQPSPFKPVTGIAGTEDGAVDEKRVAATAKVRGALQRLSKIDSELPDTLTTLADFAEKKPTEYLAFRPMIKSMI